ncbi:unnamed protein product [Citrullus colocynthis]|uniref:Uncharacterized protein n=1 Tax=Citrullus colocynthis TaxID=252529 RepID=A0ABP0Y5A8_9ROSI
MTCEEKKQEEEDGSSDDAFPFHKLLSYGDALDWVLMALGTFGSLLHGLAQPIGYILLGKALNAFGNNINDLDAMVHALYQNQGVPIMKLHLVILIETKNLSSKFPK